MNLLMSIAEITASLAECFISIFFLIRYFGYKNRISIIASIICFALLGVDNIFLAQKKGYETVSIILFFALILCLTILFYKGKIIEKIIFCSLLLISIAIINLAILNFIMMIVRVGDISKLHTAKHSTSLRLIILFTTKFFYFLITRAILNINKKLKYSFSSSEWIFLISFFCFSIFLCLSIWSINRTHNDFNPALYLFTIGGVAALNIMLYFLLQRLGKENIKKIEIALLNLKLKEQEQLIFELNTQYSEVKILKHDMKNYIQIPLTLINNNNVEKAKKYLEDLYISKIDTLTTTVYTGDSVIDAVINSKMVICSKSGIQTKCEITSSTFDILKMDLSILLSNLFDNAIEASNTINEPKEIILVIKQIKSYLNIMMKNHIGKSVLENNPILKTEKLNKNQHGYGLRSIREITVKHAGALNIYEEEKYFIVDILLNLNE